MTATPARTAVLVLMLCSFAFARSYAQEAAKPDSSSTTATQAPSGGSDAVREDQVRKVGGSVSAPRMVHLVSPEYSEEARREKFVGQVVVGLIVDTDGLPQNVHVVRGVGHGLDEKAIEAIKQYRFRPAMENGKPVPVRVNVEVNFQIKERKQ